MSYLSNRGVGMNSVKVETGKLREAISKNREEHRDVFLKAQERYKTAVIAALERMLKDARAGIRVNHHIELEAPQDHTKDYDRVLAMLDMTVEPEVTISATEFECFVMDRWPWASQFGANTLSYGISNKYVDPSDYEITSTNG